MIWWMWIAIGATSAAVVMVLVTEWLMRGYPVDREEDGAEAEAKMDSVRAKLGELK